MAAISSLGVGSGLDLSSLVNGLIEAERAPVSNRLAQKEQDLSTELSAFGLLRSSLSQFQSSFSGLQSSTAFDAKSITLSDDDAPFDAKVENFADLGNYSVEVTAIAKAQSLASNAATAFATVDDVVGEGTLTIQFGTTETLPSYSFTPDAGQSPHVLDISAANGNNTLSGLRDYINDNDFDVQAAIVNDGSGYRLVLTSERTGAANSMEITVTGDTDSNDNDNAGLSQLAFNASAQGSLSQTVAAQDAALTINGLAITRDTNSVTGAINGVTLELNNADVGNIVNVEVSENRSEISASINGFVEAYNALAESIDELTAYNPETQSGSVLTGDFTVRSIESRIRSIVFGSVSGLQGNIRSLVDIGITTDSSGKLQVDQGKLNDALNDYPEDVEALFSIQASSSDSGIVYRSSTVDTVAGEYGINLTSLLTSASLSGSDPVNSLTVNANNDELSLVVDGYATGTILLTSATYASEAALASEIQSQINADAALTSNGISVSVSYDSGSDRFVIASDSEGSGSSVEITTLDTQSNADFGFSVGAGTPGTDLAGSIGGQLASVSGSLLTSPGGNSKGLAVEVVSGTTGNRGSVTITRGVAHQLDDLLDTFLQTGGFIASREESINESLNDIEDDRIKLDDRIAALETRLIRQFSALDALVAQFNQTSSFLAQQLANLPQPNSGGSDS